MGSGMPRHRHRFPSSFREGVPRGDRDQNRLAPWRTRRRAGRLVDYWDRRRPSAEHHPGFTSVTMWAAILNSLASHPAGLSAIIALSISQSPPPSLVANESRYGLTTSDTVATGRTPVLRRHNRGGW